MPNPISSHDGLADYGLLINPPKEPSPRVAKAVDFLSWALPVVAAALSTWGGIEALSQQDRRARHLPYRLALSARLGCFSLIVRLAFEMDAFLRLGT
jgi:hypothetical protein